MALAAGDQLGPYEILESIGAGGMGIVYRARDTRLRRTVALKVLPDSLAADPERLARFEREARVLASLNHPNIAQIYGIEQGALVMELVAGKSPKGPMPFDEAWKIATQVAEALEFAHERGVVHRDLKPANIKLTPDGTVKLLDFGLAKALATKGATSEESAGSLTVTMDATKAGTILGTPAYMSPEQAKGQSVGQGADIWAFGVMLYELLTGQLPFRGETASEAMAAVLHEAPDLNLIPLRARPLLVRCLDKDPKNRLRHIGDAPMLLGPDRAVAPQT